jgi:hypothetical protein
MVREAEVMMTTTIRGEDHATSCLYWTAAICAAAAKRGIRLIPQAGSASWRRLPHELDDGKPETATHFSYVYEEGTDPRPYLARGILPECHCWAADPKRNEIVDLTTRFLPTVCDKLTGLAWLTPAPPSFVWGNPLELRAAMPDCSYVASVEACMLAYALISKEVTRILGRRWCA